MIGSIQGFDMSSEKTFVGMAFHHSRRRKGAFLSCIADHPDLVVFIG